MGDAVQRDGSFGPLTQVHRDGSFGPLTWTVGDGSFGPLTQALRMVQRNRPYDRVPMTVWTGEKIFMRRIEINSGWKLEKVPHGASFYHADPEQLLRDRKIEKEYEIKEFPAEIHDVLIGCGEIINPNLTGVNPDTWTDEYDWVYRCKFRAQDPKLPSRLRFGGLDTFCFAYLNGTLIGKYENDYRSYLTPELDNLEEENELVLYFFSPKKTTLEFDEAPEEEGFVLKECATRAFKSGFHDFCGPLPGLIRVGAYDTVELLQRESVRIAEMKTDTALSEDLSKGCVTVRVEVEAAVDAVPLMLCVYDENGELAAQAQGSTDGASCELSCTVENVNLWWPRTHGKPYCYRIVVQAGGEDGDTAVRNVGFRRLEMAGDLDFRVNGHPIRLYGANLAHPDTISNVYRPKRMGRLLDLAELGNYNCLRIWGESEIYPDAFYDECDRRGILLWQDFYLCYAMYSEQEPFIREISAEAEELVKRLRHHPCILLWCGGNEIFLSRDYDFPGHYCFGEKILLEVFPEICRRLDPERVYHICSPYGGRDANDPEVGDTHGYTHLWFVPGRLYPNFLSENCRVSIPPLRTLHRMMTDEELWPKDYDPRITPHHRMPWPDAWSNHNSNIGHVKLGPVESYYDATNVEEMVYRIGAAHAEYIRRDLERFRRGYSAEGIDQTRRTKGHILWKFNNNSNIISYGIVDYFHEVYYPYYELKRMYEPVLLAVEWGNHAHVFMTNDTMETKRGKLCMQLFDMETGEYVMEAEQAFEVLPDEAKPIATLDPFGQFRRKYIVVLKAYDETGAMIARTLDWFELEKKMIFPEDTGICIRREGNGLVITTQRFARCVELSGSEDGDEFGFYFSDNYFDLLPGEEKRVEVFGDHTKGRIIAKAFYAQDRSETEWDVSETTSL